MDDIVIQIVKDYGINGLMILVFIWAGRSAFSHFVKTNSDLLSVNQEIWKSTAALTERCVTAIDDVSSTIEKKDLADDYKHKEVVGHLVDIKKKINAI